MTNAEIAEQLERARFEYEEIRKHARDNASRAAYARIVQALQIARDRFSGAAWPKTGDSVAGDGMWNEVRGPLAD